MTRRILSVLAVLTVLSPAKAEIETLYELATQISARCFG